MPEVVIKADRELPGPRTLAGVVRDTAEATVPDAEVSIPRLQRRTFTKADGSFRFDDIASGRYVVRAKRIGYAPQTRTIIVEGRGGAGDFALLPLTQAMPAVVTSATRGGLSGVVADTSFQGLPGVEVRVLAKGMAVESDSLGAFYLPVPSGSYMVTLIKNGFAHRVVSITIPPDSGRHLTVSMFPSAMVTPVREAWNLVDLNGRLATRNKQQTSFYTRQDLKDKGIEWVNQAVVMGGLDQYDDDCFAVLNGGPTTINLSALTVDDIESVEIYGSRRATGGRRRSGESALPTSNTSGPRPAKFKVPSPMDNSQLAAFQNQSRYCATVYVWTR